MKSDWKIRLPQYSYELNAANSTLSISPCAWTKGSLDCVLDNQEYLNLLEHAISEIRNGKTSKIVLSRIIPSSHKHVDDSVVLLFQQKFPFSCAFYIPRTEEEIWFGATPELLLEGKDGVWKTRSIAGTRVMNSNMPWGEKEFSEQSLVTEGIIEALHAGNAKNILVGDQYTFQSGSIEHICSDIQFEFTGDVEKIIRFIHPTAAVLGKPRDLSQKWLVENEPHNREWYTGTFQVEHQNTIYVYVFLRCGKANANGIQWYVGGGLTAESVAQDELQETMNKANSLEQVLSSQT